MPKNTHKNKNVHHFVFQESTDDKSPNAPPSTISEIQQLRDQLEQQALQTREALFQLMQVREQLISETNARIEAQVRIKMILYIVECENRKSNLMHVNVFDFYRFHNLYIICRRERNSCCNRIENYWSIWHLWAVTRTRKMNGLA